MAIIQCPQGHYYDKKRSPSCPYCEKMLAAPDLLEGLNEQMTSYVEPVEEEEQLTEGYAESVGSFERTIGVFLDETHSQLTVGWLVCVSGSTKGKSYTLHSGRNFAGSAADMDILLAEDAGIKPVRHFSVVYDPKGTAFYLVGGEGHTYVNGLPVPEQVQLQENDEITAGLNRFVFVPFCREDRKWD